MSAEELMLLNCGVGDLSPVQGCLSPSLHAGVPVFSLQPEEPATPNAHQRVAFTHQRSKVLSLSLLPTLGANHLCDSSQNRTDLHIRK